MTTATKAYVSRVAGLPVFDPNGDKVGTVRDVVVVLRIGREAPRVLGLVMEIQGRKRIFVADEPGRLASTPPPSSSAPPR